MNEINTLRKKVQKIHEEVLKPAQQKENLAHDPFIDVSFTPDDLDTLTSFIERIMESVPASPGRPGDVGY